MQNLALKNVKGSQVSGQGKCVRDPNSSEIFVHIHTRNKGIDFSMGKHGSICRFLEESD